MQVWKDIEVIIEGKTCKVRALFDSGSSFTVMGYSTFKELFGEILIKPLPKPVEAALANGQKITLDGYIDSQTRIENYVIVDIIFLSPDMAKKAIIEGREVTLPDLIIGSPTMETWGIELDLKKGDIAVRGGGFLL